MIQMKPDREAFERVCEQLQRGETLNCKHVVDVFGWPAVELYLLCIPDVRGIADMLDDIRRKLNAQTH